MVVPRLSAPDMIDGFALSLKEGLPSCWVVTTRGEVTLGHTKNATASKQASKQATSKQQASNRQANSLAQYQPASLFSALEVGRVIQCRTNIEKRLSHFSAVKKVRPFSHLVRLRRAFRASFGGGGAGVGVGVGVGPLQSARRYEPHSSLQKGSGSRYNAEAHGKLMKLKVYVEVPGLRH